MNVILQNAARVCMRIKSKPALLQSLCGLLDCLERNEQNGIIYHREGIMGDYDEFDDLEELIHFIKTGIRMD